MAARLPSGSLSADQAAVPAVRQRLAAIARTPTVGAASTAMTDLTGPTSPRAGRLSRSGRAQPPVALALLVASRATRLRVRRRRAGAVSGRHLVGGAPRCGPAVGGTLPGR